MLVIVNSILTDKTLVVLESNKFWFKYPMPSRQNSNYPLGGDG